MLTVLTQKARRDTGATRRPSADLTGPKGRAAIQNGAGISWAKAWLMLSI
jgi:hypothetical protein